MPSTNSVPILSSYIFEPFLGVARGIGVPMERWLRTAGLPVELDYEGGAYLPEIPCWRFLQEVARTEGLDTYGLLAGSAAEHPELPCLAPHLRQCTTLKGQLIHFCKVAPLVSNVVAYRLEVRGETVWLSNQGRRLLDSDVHAQLFQVLGMIQLVQRATGPKWRPAEIHFTFPEIGRVADAPELNPSKIRFSRPYPAVSLPRALLAKRVLPPEFADGSAGLPPVTLNEQLSDVLLPYIGNGDIRKEAAAEIVGLSSRTLQRYLNREMTSYQEVLDRARLRKATRMLEETDAKFIEIALSLGYEEAASFTRAFRRWTGVTPREYRKALVTES